MLEIIYLIIALFTGILAGTITGISPGIHINLVSVFVVSLIASTNLPIEPLTIVIFLVAMAMTHTFVDFIPSIFLGAPDEDNVLSILPGHEMLNKGQAYNAIVYTLYGSASALLIILIFSPLFYFLLPTIYPYVERIMPIILLVASGFLIYFEKSSRIWAILIFLLSGILGLATFNLPIKESLLPLFTGLFGISSLITSINKKQKIPKQRISKLKNIKLKQLSFIKAIIASAIASPFCSFLPGMGSGQAAVIGSNIIGDLKRKEFLVLLGSINTIVMGLSFITLYSISKARTGVAVSIGKLIDLNLSDLITITIAI
ncbi:MAG: tripartite tricarboxylate transporter permease, partial [archaeon]|nr:tripartite tricarboxylate transporter permease [archaeon]